MTVKLRKRFHLACQRWDSALFCFRQRAEAHATYTAVVETKEHFSGLKKIENETTAQVKKQEKGTSVRTEKERERKRGKKWITVI